MNAISMMYDFACQHSVISGAPDSAINLHMTVADTPVTTGRWVSSETD